MIKNNNSGVAEACGSASKLLKNGLSVNSTMGLKTTLAGLLLVTVSACGGGSDDDPEADVVLTAAEGSWLTECGIDAEGDPNQVSLDVTGAEFKFIDTLFVRNTDCSPDNQLFVRERAGSFIEVGSSENANGVVLTQIDVATDAYVITAVSEAAAMAANTLALCAKNDWEAAVSYDMSSCDVFENGLLPPYTVYDLYGISEDAFFLGAGGAADTVENRPVELAATATFARQ